jgi:hypothetical protein
MNSRFRFLEDPGQCPILPSTRLPATACWSHPGSYLKDLGIQVLTSNKELQRLHIQSGRAQKGFESILYNDYQLNIFNTSILNLESSGIRLLSTHEIEITTEDFIMEIENIDHFLNLRSIRVQKPFSRLRSHGLIGQTWSTTIYKGGHKYTEGDIDDYVITEDNVFGVDFPYNLFSVETLA